MKQRESSGLGVSETRVLGLSVGLSRTHPQTLFPPATRGRKGAGPWAPGRRPRAIPRPALAGGSRSRRTKRPALGQMQSGVPPACACARWALSQGLGREVRSGPSLAPRRGSWGMIRGGPSREISGCSLARSPTYREQLEALLWFC